MTIRYVLGRYWETEGANSEVKGSLKAHAGFWKGTLKASNVILSVIEYGYKIPFTTEPTPFTARNNKSSLDHHAFVDKALKELILKGCVEVVETEPFCCNPLTVAGEERSYAWF